MEEKITVRVFSEVKIEIDVAEEPEDSLIHPMVSHGCQATRDQRTLPHQPECTDGHCHVKAEPATCETVGHLITWKSIKVEPGVHESFPNSSCENVNTEPAGHETSLYSPDENTTQAEGSACNAEVSQGWEEEGLMVKFEPGADTCMSSLQQEKQASSPCPVWQEEDATDCCELNSVFEPASTGAGELKVEPVRRHVCDVCSKSFIRASHLKTHKLIHSGQKPYMCAVCSRSFTQAGHLLTHKLLHTGQKPFVCEVCSKSFTVAGHLKRHKRTHTGERPFLCDMCSKSFNQAGTLKRHKQTHTGEWPFVCNLLPKRSASGRLKKQKQIHGEDRPSTTKVTFVTDVPGVTAKGDQSGAGLKALRQQMLRKVYNSSQWTHVFTSGSREGDAKNGSSRIFIRHADGRTVERAIPTSKLSTNFRAEAEALWTAATIVGEEIPPPSHVVFLTDCKSLTESLPSSTDKLSKDTLRKLDELASSMQVTVQWIPAHCGSVG